MIFRKDFPMFRLMGNIYKDTHLLKSAVVCDDTKSTRTKKVFHCLDRICHEFDLPAPIWLDANIKDFQKFSKVRFSQDNFIEVLDFDYFELHIIEED